MGHMIHGTEMRKIKEREEILYKMARLMRNTDGIHPSTKEPIVGNLLMRLRAIDGAKYDRECIHDIPDSSKIQKP